MPEDTTTGSAGVPDDESLEISTVVDYGVDDLLKQDVPSLYDPLPDSGEEDRSSCPVCLSPFGETLEERVPDTRPFIICYSGHQTCGDCAAELEVRSALRCPLCRGRLTSLRILNRPLLASPPAAAAGAGSERSSSTTTTAVQMRRREFFELGLAATRRIRELKVREDALMDREAELNAANGRFAHDGYFTLSELSAGREDAAKDPFAAADGYWTLGSGRSEPPPPTEEEPER